MRVLVLFPGALGDLCLLAPALAALASRGARVELSVRRAVAPVAALLLPEVALGPPLDGAAMATIFGGDVAPSVRAWIAGADRVVAWLARGEVGTFGAALGVQPELHAVPRDDGDPHVSAVYAAALGVGPPLAPIRAHAPLATSPFPWDAPERARLVLHPGAGGTGKAWAAEGFRQVAESWRARGGGVAILLGPAEAATVSWWRAGGLPLAVDLTIADAAALVADAPLWVGNDAGMSHLAAALGRHGVVLFGATSPERWRPLGGGLVPVRFAMRSVAQVVRDVLALLRGQAA